MPVQLDETDQAIIKALAKDGRKSFRQIARETEKQVFLHLQQRLDTIDCLISDS